METKFLELLNATLGMSILLIMLVLIRDLRKQVFEKEKNIKVAIILMGTGIFVFSIRELIQYGITAGKDDVLDELLEMLYLLLTLGAFFSLLTIKELPSPKMKEK
jgi:hypothetical protein